MVDKLDKKDLIIQSVVNQRNNAMNVISDLESELHLLKQKIEALESEFQKSTEQI